MNECDDRTYLSDVYDETESEKKESHYVMQANFHVIVPHIVQ